MSKIDGIHVVNTDATKAAAKVASQWEQLRQQRNAKLLECDYTQIPDAPLTQLQKDAYATYRTTLRNLPANTIDPMNPVWPNKP